MKMCQRQQTDRQAVPREGRVAHDIRKSPRRLWSCAWIIALALCLGLLSSCGKTPTQTVQDTPHTSPTSEGRQPFHAAIQTFDRELTVTLTITPNRAGTNVFTVRLRANHPGALLTAVSVTLYTTMQDMPMGTDAIRLHADSDGSFSATGILSMQGHWAIGLLIQTADHRIHKGGVMLVTPV